MKGIIYLFWLIIITTADAQSGLEIPSDDEQYIYGVGTDIDYNNAQKFALADISQKLATRIQSTNEILQNKVGSHTDTFILQRTKSSSIEVDLPNVKVIKNVKVAGQWWIILKVERKLIQLSLEKQIIALSDVIRQITDKYRVNAGPACWYSLVENESKAIKLNDLIPVYLGSSINVNPTERYRILLKQYDLLLQKCVERNQYAIKFSTNASSKFQLAIIQTLRDKGFKLTEDVKPFGEIRINLEEKYTYTFNNHLNIINGEIAIYDELDHLKQRIKFKGKGSSFSSKKEANVKAVENSLNKFRALSI
ncbi:MAG: LPP20 family lipoprotein [Colwellia sp.]|nr:LPP20 family lipoprotein [Colwellia sp.]